MLIKVLTHDKIQGKNCIELRVEQEQEPFNSFNFNVELPVVEGQSNSDLYTLAYSKIKNQAIEGFKKVAYAEEVENADGFVINDAILNPVIEPQPEPDVVIPIDHAEVEKAARQLETIELLTELGAI